MNKLRYPRARFAEMTMHPEAEDNQAKYKKWLKKKSGLLEQIQHFEHQLDEVKAKLKQTAKHITWGELEEEDPAAVSKTKTAMSGLLMGTARLTPPLQEACFRACSSPRQIFYPSRKTI